MTVLKTILTELLGLFVDDGSMVLGLIAWVLGCVVLLHAQILPPAGVSVVMAAGIALLLAENVLRAARAHAGRGASK